MFLGGLIFTALIEKLPSEELFAACIATGLTCSWYFEFAHHSVSKSSQLLLDHHVEVETITIHRAPRCL